MDFLRPTRAVPLRLVAGAGHYEGVIDAVLAAERSVWIATANLKELMVEDTRARPGRRRSLVGSARPRGSFRSMLEAFDEMVGRGVDVRILHASTPSRIFARDLRRSARLSGKTRPASAGRFELRLCPRVHVKAVIVDGGLVYLGSANWTGAGLGAKGEDRRNFEVGLLSRDDLLLDEIQAYYDALWRGRPCGACKLRDACPRPLDTP